MGDALGSIGPHPEAGWIARASAIVGRHGAILAAALAAAMALPGLWLPFLADDWANLSAVEHGVPLGTPFRYFRPLYLATYWIERKAWGLSPALSHLTNVVLVAVAAALLVVIVRRLTGDAALAGLAGFCFALHPYHIESTAWIAGRSDSLYAVLFMASILSYDRWVEKLRGFPLVAVLLYEAALLAKEAAVVLPAFLILLRYCRRGGRPDRREWVRGIVPLLAVAIVHFVWLRPSSLAGPQLDFRSGFGLSGIKRLGTFLIAAILPAQTELIERGPWLWLAAALALGLAIVALAHARTEIPNIAWAAAAAFFVLLAPALTVSFQERYFFLPSAASAVGLTALLRATRSRTGLLLSAMLVSGWLVSNVDQWIGWDEAGVASASMLDGLEAASRPPQIEEIVVVNAPHRVRGAPVICDWSSAVRLSSGGRSVTVTAAPYVDYAGLRARILDGARDGALRRRPSGVEVASVIPVRLYSRYVAPPIPAGSDRVEKDGVTIVAARGGALLVQVAPRSDGARTACLWSEGRLERLF